MVWQNLRSAVPDELRLELEVVDSKGSRVEIAVRMRTRIGAAPNADLRLEAEGVLPVHADLLLSDATQTGGGSWSIGPPLFHSGPAPVIVVDGQPLAAKHRATVRAGTKLTLGAAEIRIVRIGQT